MKNLFLSIGSAAILAGVGAGLATAEPVFNRIATWPVWSNLPAGADRTLETSAEIIEATEDGMTVVYTDSPLRAIGMIDITDPKSPKPAGVVELGGEPTSLAIIAGRALVVVDTTRKFTEPAGHLAVIDLTTKTIVKTCDLGGQPREFALGKLGRQALNGSVSGIVAHRTDPWSRRPAAARASSVTRAPASMRAISSRRSASPRASTEVSDPGRASPFETRQ